MAMNIGANRALNPTGTFSNNGAWSWAVEAWANTDYTDLSGHAYKYNDNLWDGVSAQTTSQPVANMGADFEWAVSVSVSGNTQTIEMKIAVSQIEIAFGRTYQNGTIAEGDNVSIIGFFNNAGGWTPINYPRGADLQFGNLAFYETLTVQAAQTAQAAPGNNGGGDNSGSRLHREVFTVPFGGEVYLLMLVTGYGIYTISRKRR